MEGLNITIFNYKDIFIDNIEFRIDAEYYQKEYLYIYEKLHGSKTLNELVYMSDVSSNGAFAYVHDVLNDNNPKTVPYIRSGNVGSTFINTNELELISQQAHQKLPKSTTKLHDVMMARKGKIGGASIITEDEVNFNCNENVIKLTIHSHEYNPFYFTTFFNSKFGLKQVERISTGNVQPWVSIFQIKKLLIPKLDLSLQQEIENIVKKSHEAINISKQKYAEAETLLLENLGLQNFQTTNQSVNIKALKDSFLQTGRLDAEFYQSKYDELENLFNRFERIKLADLVNYPISSGITPKANGDDYADKESGIAFIRAVDLQNGEVNLDNLNYIKPNIHQTTLKRTQLKQNDVLLSIAGTVGRCAIFTHDMPANINQAVAILRFDESKVNRLYLVAFFNSELGKQFIAKYARQGLQTNLNLTEIGELSIPIPDMTIQTQIANYICQSNELREQATQLLAQAKSNVELEIENNSFNINELEFEGGGLSLLEKSAYFIRLAEWTLLESLIFAQKTNVSIRSLSQSFGLSGRLDAEYYHPKFERLLHKLKQQNCKTLGELADLQKSVEVGSENYRDEGLPFVRVADFSKFGIGQTNKFVNPADYTDIIRPKKDTILLSKDGTVGIAYHVPSDMEVITSGAIVHLSLKTDEILPDYLALVLNSKAVQLQAERDAGGSIIQHWKPSEILEVVIPILPKDIQKMIADKVQMSFELKNQSENLLAQAKILVENEIESI